jgi:hypothetical protein
MKTHSKRLAELAQTLTPVLLQMQNMDKESQNYGDYIMQPKGYSEPGALLMPIMHFVGMYYHENSPYYKNVDLLTRSSLLMNILLNNIHDDGTIDLKETNFHDATAVAFLITPMAHTYRVIKKLGEGSDLENEIRDKMMKFFEKGAEGMRNGGFHTPNHRWVMAAALSIVSNILENPIYKDEAMKYLNEGIDCDEEGEYLERSTAIYDITVNESLIVIAHELDMLELLEHVARNIKKNFAYLEPDGTICTLNSRRQDNTMKYYPLRHYLNVLFLAHHYKDGFFAGMAEYLLTQMEKKKYELPNYLFTGGKEDVHTPLIQYLLDDSLADDISSAELVWDGHWYYPINGVVRKRDGNVSLTLIRDREVFLKYQNGSNTLTAKIASCFFGQGYFVPTTLEKTEYGYKMTASTEQGYYKPLNEKIGIKEFYDIRQKREKVHVQKHDTVVDIVLDGNDIKVKVGIDGAENVPIKIELMLSAGGRLETEDIIINGDAGNNLILKNGGAAYTLDRNVINIKNGVAAHWNAGNMRGTRPASSDHLTIYMTGFTPFSHEFTISDKNK